MKLGKEGTPRFNLLIDEKEAAQSSGLWYCAEADVSEGEAYHIATGYHFHLCCSAIIDYYPSHQCSKIDRTTGSCALTSSLYIVGECSVN